VRDERHPQSQVVGHGQEVGTARQLLAVVRVKLSVQADVDGALAASVFHSGAIAIADLKRYLREQQIEVRDVY
jgi:imidazole glycerol phosphate synthase subunit HisF